LTTYLDAVRVGLLDGLHRKLKGEIGARGNALIAEVVEGSLIHEQTFAMPPLDGRLPGDVTDGNAVCFFVVEGKEKPVTGGHEGAFSPHEIDKRDMRPSTY